MTATELMAADIGEREFAVHELVPLGSVTVMSAKKGRGKSVTTMVMGDRVSRGREFLGRVTKQGQVLYIGSEDDAIELRKRYSALVASSGDEPSADLDLADDWPKAAEGGIDRIRDWCAACETPRMVIVDVVAHVAPELINVRRGWGAVLEALSAWIKLAREENIAVVLVTHNYRGADFVDNPIEQIQGSGGLTAYAQTCIVIQGKDKVPERQMDYGGKFGAGRLALSISGAAMTCELRDAEPEATAEQSFVRSLIERVIRRNPGLKARTVARMLPGRTVDSTVRLMQLMADAGQLVVIDRRYFVLDSEEAEQLTLANGLEVLAS